MSGEKIKILLVDDHDIVRAGLEAILSAEPDFQIVGAARSGQEALALLEKDVPDVVLMDITMPDMDGLEATRRIKMSCERAKVLALTIHEGQDYFFAMLQAGASGYVPKRAASEDLISAIRALAHGEIYLHPSVAGTLVQSFLRSHEPQQVDENQVALQKLTDREREVLILISEGLRNQDIAAKLGISPKTVSRHRENILQKLNLETRADLIRYAIQVGLID